MSSTTPPVRRFVVVSDFHMAGGRDERGCLARYEAFLQDDVFAALLDYIAERANAGRETCTLVLLGDFVDFLHTLPSAGREGSCTALVKLNRIARGHRAVFEALSDLRRRGCALAIVPGNHDIEFLEAAVQHRFLELIGDEDRDLSSAVFHPWIYYVPGVLYAEHGSQYHDINAFAALLRAGVDDRLGAVPLGSHLSRYAVDLLESLGAGDERPPELGRALRALSAMPRGALRTAPLHARLFTAAAAGSLPVGSRSPRARPLPRDSPRIRGGHRPSRGDGRSDRPAGRDVPVVSISAHAACARRPRLGARRGTSPVAGSGVLPPLRLRGGRRAARAGGTGGPFLPFRPFPQGGAGGDSTGRAHLSQHGHLVVHASERLAAFGPGGRLTFVDVEVVDGQEPRAELLRWDSEAGRSVIPGGEDACGVTEMAAG